MASVSELCIKKNYSYKKKAIIKRTRSLLLNDHWDERKYTRSWLKIASVGQENQVTSSSFAVINKRHVCKLYVAMLSKRSAQIQSVKEMLLWWHPMVYFCSNRSTIFRLVTFEKSLVHIQRLTLHACSSSYSHLLDCLRSRLFHFIFLFTLFITYLIAFFAIILTRSMLACRQNNTQTVWQIYPVTTSVNLFEQIVSPWKHRRQFSVYQGIETHI